jgi:hypothetical protein
MTSYTGQPSSFRDLPSRIKLGMSDGDSLPPSKRLYQLVALGRDGSRTVLLTGLSLAEACAARDSIPNDNAVVWFMVEREEHAQ